MATPNPSNPPIPATIAGAAFVELGVAELTVADEELLEGTLEEAWLFGDGALVVAATPVVISVTLVVDAGIEDVVVTADAEEGDGEVVEAETAARDAE
jgi:hypothetical protein